MTTRYSRQTLFQPIGEEGQERLAKASVVIVGMGALGTATATHFVRAGIGHVRLIDRDFVEWSNLQRQQLFDEEDARQLAPKAEAAKNKLEKINSTVTIESIITDVTASNVMEHVDGMDVIVDGTDNFSTRFLLNDVSVKYNLPFAYGGAVSSRSLAGFFIPGKTPCLRCMISGGDHGETCDTVGVISPAVAITAALQTTSVLQWLVHEELEQEGLTSFDAWTGRYHHLPFTAPKATCPTCQSHEYPSLNAREKTEAVLCGRDAIQLQYKSSFQLEEVAERLNPIADVTTTPFLVRAKISDQTTFVIFKDGRVLIQGVKEASTARSLYSRYLGN
ncbi:ThiF family adenylyltransferase [Aureibacillus halotolerans]|uniref:Adenylyltransferase/sulfurtransferase n=1 Tax=Aureibacillus halotolerans TaxID=1508390 RepID=A0A4R6U7E8_9BACI|nr:ThiF family adenylyltransferase [Aureibacillus halotolerans]TDQ41696.1 adenylyltransferase/sulfurtransferase [Aureibacillus halotolerans]